MCRDNGDLTTFGLNFFFTICMNEIFFRTLGKCKVFFFFFQLLFRMKFQRGRRTYRLSLKRIRSILPQNTYFTPFRRPSRCVSASADDDSDKSVQRSRLLIFFFSLAFRATANRPQRYTQQASCLGVPCIQIAGHHRRTPPLLLSPSLRPAAVRQVHTNAVLVVRGAARSCLKTTRRRAPRFTDDEIWSTICDSAEVPAVVFTLVTATCFDRGEHFITACKLFAPLPGNAYNNIYIYP